MTFVHAAALPSSSSASFIYLAIFPREIAPPVPIAAGIIISYRPRETSAPPPPKNCKRLVEASPSSAPAQSHITHWHLPTPPKATGATERTHRRPLSGLTQSPKAVPSTFITHVGTSSPFRPHSLKAATRRVSPSSPVPYARHLTHSLILINRHFGENIARICGPWALTLTRLFARLRLRQAPGSGFQGPSGLLSIASFAKHLDDRRRGSN